jgi:hypothetical protein
MQRDNKKDLEENSTVQFIKFEMLLISNLMTEYSEWSL